MYILYAQYHTIQRTKFIISSLSPDYEAINFTCLVSSLMHILRLYLESKLHTENTWKHVKMTCKVLSVWVLLCVHAYMLGDLIIPLEHQFGYGVVYISPLKLEWNCLGGCGPWGTNSSVVGAPAAKAVGPSFNSCWLFWFFFVSSSWFTSVDGMKICVVL